VYVILSNLVKNAIKFTKEGSIEIGCNISKTDPHPELIFYVKDTGIGIHPENMNTIFERFRQGNESNSRNYEGAGLGLSISKAYVKMLGGQIWVESEVKKGSTFYFTIPYFNSN
jgi:signal transduction histidine kinase